MISDLCVSQNLIFVGVERLIVWNWCSLRPDYAVDFRAWLREELSELSETPESEVSVSRPKEDESGSGARTTTKEVTLEDPTTPRHRISFTSVC